MTTGEVVFRLAGHADLPSIVRMLAEDDLGSQRERYEEPLPESYQVAFEQIARDANHELIVVELNGTVIGTLHLMFLPSISFQCGLRAQIESVRVDKPFQGKGIGSELMRWTIARVALMQVGTWLGYVAFGFASDAFGRKRTYVTYLVAAAALLAAFTLTRSVPLLVVLGPVGAFFAARYFSGFGAVSAERTRRRYGPARRASPTTWGGSRARPRPSSSGRWPTRAASAWPSRRRPWRSRRPPSSGSGFPRPAGASSRDRAHGGTG